MKVKDVYKIIDGFAPFESACAWDNCGLNCGDMNDNVTGIYLTLDADLYALEKAKEHNANLVISHHPMISDGLKKITADHPVYFYIKNGVSVISAHTCLDATKGGINDVLCKIAGICDTEPLITDGVPLGRIGISSVSDGEQYAKLLCEKLNTGAQYIINRPVKRVAVVGGSGGGCLEEAVKAGCDTLVTGEVKHSHFVHAQDIGFNIIALGHFETENIILETLAGKLSGLCPVFVSDRKYNLRRM